MGYRLAGYDVVGCNDIDPGTAADVHMDAMAFLRSVRPRSLDAVIIDPPFSFNQAQRHYRASGGRFLGVGWIPAVRRLAGTRLRRGGLMFCLGWDGNGAGDRRRFELVRVVVCCHGQARNATIMTIDRKKV